MPTDEQIEKWKDGFRAKGPEGVREGLAASVYGPPHGPHVRFAEKFLAECEAEEANRHKTTELELTRDANDIARRSNRISIGAAIASGVSTLIAAAAFAKAIGWW